MSVTRRSRLVVRSCPQCATESLVSNGGFWSCACCRYAVTSTALAMDCAKTEASFKALATCVNETDERDAALEPELVGAHTADGRR